MTLISDSILSPEGGIDLPPAGLKISVYEARQGRSYESKEYAWEDKEDAWHLTPHLETRRTQRQNAHRLLVFSAISVTLRFENILRWRRRKLTLEDVKASFSHQSPKSSDPNRTR